MSSIILFSTAALLVASPAYAATCYNRYGNPYYCSGGLANGARIGIGIAVAAAFLLLFGLCGYMRRRKLRAQFAKYRPPAPGYNNGAGGDPSNPYANNPPPPAAGTYYGNQGSNTDWQNNNYGNNPPPPQSAYQPSMAGQYGGAKSTGGQEDHEHGYEWQQAREQERLEREQAAAGNGNDAAPPPGYDVAASAHNTGSTNQYAPPPGPPPSNPKRTTEGTV